MGHRQRTKDRQKTPRKPHLPNTQPPAQDRLTQAVRSSARDTGPPRNAGAGVTVHGEWAIHSCPRQKQQGEESCAHRLSLQGWGDTERQLGSGVPSAQTVQKLSGSNCIRWRQLQLLASHVFHPYIFMHGMHRVLGPHRCSVNASHAPQIHFRAPTYALM